MDTLLREKAEREFKKTARLMRYVEGGFLLIIAIVVEVVKRQYAPFQGFSPFPQIDQLRYILLAVAAIDLVVPRLLRFIRKPASSGNGETLILQLRLEALIEYALCSSSAIFGLVLFLVGGQASDCYLFMGLSAVGFFIYFPRFDRWEQYLSRVESERTPSKKSPPGRIRQIVTIVLVMGLLFSVIEQISEYKTKDLKEKAKQEAIRPTPVPTEKEAAPVVTNKEESKEVLGVIPSLNAKVTSLRFFESGYETTKMGERVYASQFRRDRSRYIYWELRLAHPKHEQRNDFQIDEVWYKPDGAILEKQSLKSHLQESWCYSFYYHSWGWEEPSQWLPGKYRVELSINGSRFAVGLFTII